MTLLLKHSAQKGFKNQQRDRTPPREQLHLFEEGRSSTTRSAQRKPLSAIYATESLCKCPGSGRWWNIRCSYNKKMFGGLYSIAERNIILKGFEGRTEPVSLNEFEAAAKYAMKATAQGVRA